MKLSLLYRFGGFGLVPLLVSLLVFGCGGDNKSTSPATTPPALSMTLACDNGLVTFEVTNPGGAMKQASSFIADYADGHADTLSVLLAHNDTLDCRLSNVHGAVKVSSDEWGIQDSAGACLNESVQDVFGDINLSDIIAPSLGSFSILTCHYSLNLQNLKTGAKAAELIPNDSGLTLRISFSNITADFYSPDPGGICPQLTGGVAISSVVTLTAIRFDTSSSLVTLGQTQASVNGFHVNVDGFFGGIVSTIIGWLQNQFTGPMEQAISQAMEEWAGQDMSDMVIVKTSCAN